MALCNKSKHRSVLLNQRVSIKAIIYFLIAVTRRLLTLILFSFHVFW